MSLMADVDDPLNRVGRMYSDYANTRRIHWCFHV